MKVIERILLMVLLVLPAWDVCGQERSICGVVVSASDGKALESVNVMLMDSALSTSYGFRITDSKGEFNFGTPQNTQGKELVLYITGFNIDEMVVPTSGDGKPTRVEVKSKDLVIKEIVVKAESEARRGDTLSFVASSYKSISDKNIGDLMRKIPGLEVSQSGVVRYQGENINKFYIEDMDLLGSGYNVAVNNVDAESIASIEVYEQHQPIAALRGLSDSHSAAINIRLKESAKGTFNGNALLGAGVDSDGALWKGGLTGLYFSGKFQTIATYKTNNMGEDVSAELATLHSGTATSSPLLSVAMPTIPPVSQERYLDNISHAATVNSLVRLGKRTDLSAKVSHLREKRLFGSEQRYAYLMPTGESVVVDEGTSSTNTSNQTNATLSICSNGEKFYINNSTDFGIRSEEMVGLAVEDGNNIDQLLRKPALRLSNALQIVGSVGKLTLSALSQVVYNQSDERLTVEPLTFGQLFPNNHDITQTAQSVATNSLTTHSGISTNLRFGKLNIGVTGELNTTDSSLLSQLSGYADAEEVVSPEEYSNEITYTLTEAKIGPSLHYAAGNNFSATLNVPLRLIDIDSKDALRNTHQEVSTLNTAPSLVVQVKPLQNVKLNLLATHDDSYGSLYDTYAGYIMRNYRTIASMGGEMPHNSTQNYSAALAYDNIFKVVSATLRGGYMRSTSNIIYNTLYDGAMMTTEGVLLDNTVEQWNLTAALSKRIKAWRTTLNVSLGMNETLCDVMYESVLVANRSRSLSAGVKIDSTPTDWLEVNYSGAWGNFDNLFGTVQTAPINTLQQQAEVTVALGSGGSGQSTNSGTTTCFVAAQHFYNSALVASARNIVFVDAGIGWEGKMLEVMLRAQNILNNNHYSTSNRTQNLDYTYTYQLRPAALIGEIMIKF